MNPHTIKSTSFIEIHAMIFHEFPWVKGINVRPGMFDAHHFPGDLLLGDYGETPTQFGTVGRPLFGGGHVVTSSGAEFFEGFIDKDFC